MDDRELDEQIQQVQQIKAQSTDPGDHTMGLLPEPPRRRLGKWIPILAGGLVVLAIAAVVLLKFMHPADNQAATSGGAPAQTQSSSSSSTQTATNSSPSAAGTDNASLTSDLNSINSSLSQESTDQTAANSALNDQSQQITVPTN